MIAFFLTILFVSVAVVALASLADSAVRWRNGWFSIQQEMAAEQSGICFAGAADVVAFRNITPVRAGVAPLFAKAANQTAAAPTAAAA